MHKLLTADRDKNELIGLEWLLNKYSFPIDETHKVNQLVDVFKVLENELPDVLCIELDMVPEEKWELMKSFIQRYTKEVIAISAEPTFERATQAMELEASDLWIKPLSPSRVKHSLKHAFRRLSQQPRNNSNVKSHQALSYESLFVDDNIPFLYPVYMLKTEGRADLYELRGFIKQFDFYYEPLLFPTSEEIVLVFQESFPEPVKQAQRLLQEWQRVNGKPLAIVVHDKNDQQSLHHIYTNLHKRMEMTFFTGYQQVLKSENGHKWQHLDPFLTMDEQRNWVYMLDEGEMEAIKAWMYEQFFDMKPPFPDPGSLRIRLTSILAQIRRFMIRKGLTDYANEEKYKRVFDRILNSPVLYRIVQDMILFTNELLQSNLKQGTPSTADVFEEAIAYMESHFHNTELSLNEVALHIGRSPSYFSHLLTKKYGRSFREILNYTRIEKAKELLSTSDEPVQNIAASTGFKNPNYFSRVFKQLTGVTPRDYRRHN